MPERTPWHRSRFHRTLSACLQSPCGAPHLGCRTLLPEASSLTIALRLEGASGDIAIKGAIGGRIEHDVLQCLTDLFVAHAPPETFVLTTAPQFVGRNVRRWLDQVGVKTLFNEPGIRWDNGY